MDSGQYITDAAHEVASTLERHGLNYAIIGGVAASIWGEPRYTKDVDLTVFVEQGDEQRVVDILLGAFKQRPEFSKQHITRGAVMLLEASNGCPLDITLATTLAYEGMVRSRLKTAQLKQGVTVSILSAEDLVIYKCIAGRGTDGRDIVSVILRQEKKLDVEYCRAVLREFEEHVSKHSVIGMFEDALRKAKTLIRSNAWMKAAKKRKK